MSVRLGIASRSAFARLVLPASRAALCALSRSWISAMKRSNERAHVVRAGARLRMALEAEGRPVGARDALQRAVEQRAVRHPHVRAGSVVSSTAKPWFWLGDHHAAGLEVEHRMVRAVVAELHLHRLRAAREPEQLVAEADAEDRDVGLEQLRGSPRSRSRTAPDRRDRWRGTRRRASARARRSAGVCAGTTVTRQPRSASMRRMLRLMPKS